MQNALNCAARYAVNVARTVGRDWNAFWYTPADPTLLGAGVAPAATGASSVSSSISPLGEIFERIVYPGSGVSASLNPESA